jgi:hypothetical protein
VIVNTDQSITTSYVATDATGNFVAMPNTSNFQLGSTPAPGIVNGGNIFVDVANTFTGPQPTPPAATRPVLPTVGGLPATQTAVVQTQTAAARKP